jgi:hypothetical protein
VNRSIRLRKSCCGTMNMIVLATRSSFCPASIKDPATSMPSMKEVLEQLDTRRGVLAGQVLHLPRYLIVKAAGFKYLVRTRLLIKHHARYCKIS